MIFRLLIIVSLAFLSSCGGGGGGGSGEGRLYSEWLPSDSITTYTFTQDDVGGNVSMYYYIKNNDGVGVRWNGGDFFSDGTGEITEIDLYGLYNRIIFTVSE